MKKFFEGLAVAVICGAMFFGFDFGKVEAAELNFQELKSRIIMPVLPDRIRHRKDSRRLQRPAPRRVEVPSRRVESPKNIYTQRQPKKPPYVRNPKLPKRNSAQRGSYPPKRFNPPRF